MLKILCGFLLVAVVDGSFSPCFKTMNRFDALKCTRMGYYEKIQCNSESCFCVNAHNGNMAYDTRTTSNKMQPKCGKCLNDLEKLFANGDLENGTFVPKCDTVDGDFDLVQCDANKDQCNCVDPKTGSVIKGTRKKLNGTTTMTCDGIELTIDVVYFRTFPENLPYDYTTSDDPCQFNRDAGFSCGSNKSSIKYWFDKTSFHCLPFEYKGCGGNANRHESYGECESSCIPVDYSSCAMASRPAMKTTDAIFICPPHPSPNGIEPAKTIKKPKMNSESCPIGYMCLTGVFFGQCCDEKLQNLFLSELNPKCEGDRELHTVADGNYAKIVVGKTCSDNFCPKHFKCHHGKLFAYCCYYEKIQCNSESCFCVNAHNGNMAYDTRTTSNKMQPKCGKCLNDLEKLFANGDLENGTFVPKCDTVDGDFDLVQCDANKDQCNCVDPKTGSVIKGTQKKLNGTKTMTCDGIEFTVDPVYFRTFPDFMITFDLVYLENCGFNRDAGFSCGSNKSSIKYWFDKTSFHCLPFEYKGCGGNANRFDSSGACYESLDYSSCAMQSRAAAENNEGQFQCSQFQQTFPPGFVPPKTPKKPKMNAEGCPVGYTCVGGAFFNTCCEEKLQKLYYKETRPECPKGQKIYETKVDDFTSSVIGKSCSDNFCPKDYKCVAGELFAYCCK
ncbi:unnamed protein product [Caenorhabditis bovis]|uniref:BPTI/Kunitz inhibitor domain-containing protein n=1 Tax=Caenorhabditis bovis TaxID=2654633 RepID=A0A8S1ECS9_9PELO|nr:unnamed protein product [Caenorhabditis bovis]